MADLRSAFIARLAAVATGRGDLARPRRRARFEDLAPPHLIELHDEHDAAPHERRALRGTAVRDQPDGGVQRHATSVPVDSGGPRVTPSLPHDATSVPDGPRTHSPAPALPAVPEARASAEPRPARTESGVRAAATGQSSPGPAPASTPVADEDHPARQVDPLGHRLGPVVTELFQWIDEGAPVPPVTTPAPEVPPTEPEGLTTPRTDSPRGTQTHVRRRPSATPPPEPTTVVQIGRVEVRTIAPEPPRRQAVSAPASPLQFAGPTLDEFLGGRP